MRKFWSVAILVVLAACSAKYNVNNLSGTSSAKLDRTKGVYVSIPADGAYESKPYPGSGNIVAQETAAAFSKHAVKVTIGEKAQTVEGAIETGRKTGAAYAIIPVIAHWENRATEWSGRPSLMTIRLGIYDTISSEQIASTSIEGRSRIVSWTTTSPQSLLKAPLSQYVAGLY